MLGRVLFTWAGRDWQAILGDDGRWAIPAPRPEPPELGLARLALERDLNLDLGADSWSPADGPVGPLLVHRAAERLEGRAELPPQAASPPGRIY
jgi:hypothetical protein